jgi:hypothetical protein
MITTQTFRFRAEDKDKQFKSGETHFDFMKRQLLSSIQILEDLKIGDFDIIIKNPDNKKKV